jgi:hypothetical protein
MARGLLPRWFVCALLLLAVQVNGQDDEDRDRDRGEKDRDRYAYGNRVRMLKDPAPDQRRINYECWEPAEGLSNPVVTLVTIMLSHNEAQQFVQNNRKSYILNHGYR